MNGKYFPVFLQLVFFVSLALSRTIKLSHNKGSDKEQITLGENENGSGHVSDKEMNDKDEDKERCEKPYEQTGKCVAWEQKGYCDKKHELKMVADCKVSCGMCGPDNQYTDEDVKCRGYAESNQCSRHDIWIKCKYSCTKYGSSASSGQMPVYQQTNYPYPVYGQSSYPSYPSTYPYPGSASGMTPGSGTVPVGGQVTASGSGSMPVTYPGQAAAPAPAPAAMPAAAPAPMPAAAPAPMPAAAPAAMPAAAPAAMPAAAPVAAGVPVGDMKSSKSKSKDGDKKHHDKQQSKHKHH